MQGRNIMDVILENKDKINIKVVHQENKGPRNKE